MKKGTRPRKVRNAEIPIDRIEYLASRGLTHEQIAVSLGISESTLYKYKSEKSEIAEAIKRGQAQGIEEVSNALFRKAVEDGNTTAMIFYLKNRSPEAWKDSPENLDDGTKPDPVKVEFTVKDARIDTGSTEPTSE